MRSVFEILVLFSSPSATRHRQAVATLMHVVRGHAAGRVRAPHGAPLRVPDRAREDVAATVMEALVRDGRKIVARMIARSPAFESVRAEVLGSGRSADPHVRFEAHRAADSYLRRMVATSWITLLRREARQPKPSTRIVERTPRLAAVESGEQFDRAMSAVEAAVEVVTAGRTDLQATYREMWGLAMQEVTMEACTTRELGADTSPAARRAARDRLQQRHRRLRVLLVKALHDLERRHALDHEEAQLGRKFVEEVLNRGPKRRRR